MIGFWVVIVEFVIAVIFLAKSRVVRRGIGKIRETLGLVCLMILLSPLAEWVYSKGGFPANLTLVRSSPSSSRLSSVSEESVVLQTLSLPSWWKDDPSDTDGDGIPDLWEKWTHGNRSVADGAIDRDEDGLTDLEEFQNQTDPRTADTDGDGFGDAFEVANIMNPLVQADFTPTEPDVDHNGRIDLWEYAPYIYGFTDADHDGFDDIYELYFLEPESDANFDVVVTVYTTRSAVLTWNGGADGIVILPTTEQAVRLRLPFDADTELKLMPAPEGVSSPEAGGLWKGRLTLGFSPRIGQSATGSCITALNGDVSQRVVESGSTITRFPDEEASMQIAALSESSLDVWLKINVIQRRFAIVPDLSYYHSISDTVGPFSITNAVNIEAADAVWSSAHGAMSPAVGATSSLTVTRLPNPNEPIIVTAEVELDENSRVLKTAEVRLCPRNEFSLDLYTDTFSTELGSNVVFAVELPGCLHWNDPGWLEAEIMCETTSGWDHVAWVDMDPSTGAVDRYGNTTLLASFLVFTWNGPVEDSLPLAPSVPAAATAKSRSFSAASAIKADESVSPSSYRLVVRIYNTDKTTVLHQEYRAIYAL